MELLTQRHFVQLNLHTGFYVLVGLGGDILGAVSSEIHARTGTALENLHLKVEPHISCQSKLDLLEVIRVIPGNVSAHKLAG